MADSTLLWFSSDNGGHAVHEQGVLRGGKGNLYEGGVRVPGTIEYGTSLVPLMGGEMTDASEDRPMRTLGAARECGMVLAALIACCAGPAVAADHPFMLWTKDEAARMRRAVETQPWAREAYERASKELAAAASRRPGPILYVLPLFRYGVLGDKAAGEAQKALLLNDVAGGRFATADDAYRFDVLYDLLSAEERQRVAKAFTEAVEARLDWKEPFNRWNWLPNLAYGGYSRLHLLAAATGDEKLIRSVFHSPLGFKWYLDEYLSDLGFYNEELSKQISPEYILPWCWAMDRLGLAELGFGYRGRQGATVRGHVESLLCIGLPRVDLGTDLYHYPRLTMGDTRGSFGEEYFAYGFQQYNVPGVLASGPTSWWGDERAARLCRWLEYLHAKWPDAGYDYFLAGWRGPGEDRYWSSIQFGLPPISPGKVKPPPAPSGVYPGRGIVMLRADETPAYWESPAPAVGMRLANPYAHHVQDSFALMGFYAFNRPLFINPGRTTDRYCGVDPGFSNSIRSHSAVIVDGREPHHLLDGASTRQDFNASVKFAAARAKGIYAGVDQTRALMLTREYLLDASRLVSRRTRDYLWQVHTFGHVCPDNPAAWTPSYDLRGRLPDLGQEESCATDDTWTVTAVQTTCGAHPEFSGLGPRWFAKRVGVRVTMLGEAGARAYTGWTPVLPNAVGFRIARDRFAYGEEEPARIAIAATRKAAETTFLAVHEPFEGASRIRDIRRLAEGDDGAFVVRIIGDTFADYLMLRFGAAADRPVEMKWDQGAVRFAGYGYVRVAADRVDIQGGVAGLVLPVGTIPARWFVKGKEVVKPELVNGYAVWGETEASRPAAPGARPAALPRIGPLAARWHPPTELCLPTGGKREVALKLRNNGQTPLTARLAIAGSGGLAVSPDQVELRDFPVGGEREVTVSVSAGRATPHQLQHVSLDVSEPAGLPVQSPRLAVAHGMTSGGREQIGPDFRASIYSPRYIVRYWIMESGGAAQLLDPQGLRRHDASGLPLPCLAQTVTRPDGRTEDRRIEPRRQPYFNPLLIAGAGGAPDQLYDGGWHVHGYQADLEHWWTEDWMLVRQRTAKADEKVAFQWPWITSNRSRTIMGRDENVAARVKPGRTFVVDGQGKRVEAADKGLAALRDAEVQAVFLRPAGYDYGYALFYLPGAKLERGLAFHPGGRVVGFTFCREEEFDGLLKKWQAGPPSGEVSDEVRSRYRGGFGAHPVPAEEGR